MRNHWTAAVSVTKIALAGGSHRGTYSLQALCAHIIHYNRTVWCRGVLVRVRSRRVVFSLPTRWDGEGRRTRFTCAYLCVRAGVINRPVSVAPTTRGGIGTEKSEPSLLLSIQFPPFAAVAAGRVRSGERLRVNVFMFGRCVVGACARARVCCAYYTYNYYYIIIIIVYVPTRPFCAVLYTHNVRASHIPKLPSAFAAAAAATGSPRASQPAICCPRLWVLCVRAFVYLLRVSFRASIDSVFIPSTIVVRRTHPFPPCSTRSSCARHRHL